MSGITYIVVTPESANPILKPKLRQPQNIHLWSPAYIKVLIKHESRAAGKVVFTGNEQCCL
jgi:hypothetical protein